MFKASGEQTNEAASLLGIKNVKKYLSFLPPFNRTQASKTQDRNPSERVSRWRCRPYIQSIRCSKKREALPAPQKQRCSHPTVAARAKTSGRTAITRKQALAPKKKLPRHPTNQNLAEKTRVKTTNKAPRGDGRGKLNETCSVDAVPRTTIKLSPLLFFGW